MTIGKTLSSSAHFDAFDTKVTDADIANYRASGGRNPGSAWVVLIVLLSIFSIAFFIGLIVTLAGELSGGSLSSSDRREALNIAILSLAFSLPIIPIAYLNKRGGRKGMIRQIQLQRFARANGWKYDQQPGTPERPGIIFNAGAERLGYYSVVSEKPIEFTFGAYSYTTGAGKGRNTNTHGFVELSSSVNLPHVILDAKGNNVRMFSKELATTLPEAFSTDKKVSVSPELDELYNSYAIDGNAAQLAQYFTPEFLQKLNSMGSSYAYDFEIVAGKVYAYRMHEFEPTKKDMQEVLAVIDLLQETFDGEAALEIPEITAESRTDVAAQPQLRGRMPRLIRVLGIIGITVQFIVAIALVAMD